MLEGIGKEIRKSEKVLWLIHEVQIGIKPIDESEKLESS